MPITAAWRRPYNTIGQSVSTPLTYTMTEQASRLVIDVTGTVNSVNRIFSRLVLTPVLNGNSLSFTMQQLNFGGTVASTYVSATNPADSVATNVSAPIVVTLPEAVNLDTFFTNAGVAQTVPA